LVQASHFLKDQSSGVAKTQEDLEPLRCLFLALQVLPPNNSKAVHQETTRSKIPKMTHKSQAAVSLHRIEEILLFYNKIGLVKI